MTNLARPPELTAQPLVIELPVLYAVNGAGFDGNAYWLIGEVYADGKKVGEQRTQVMKETVSAKGPSVVMMKFPKGTTIPAHWHTSGETVTVGVAGFTTTATDPVVVV